MGKTCSTHIAMHTEFWSVVWNEETTRKI